MCRTTAYMHISIAGVTWMEYVISVALRQWVGLMSGLGGVSDAVYIAASLYLSWHFSFGHKHTSRGKWCEAKWRLVTLTLNLIKLYVHVRENLRCKYCFFTVSNASNHFSIVGQYKPRIKLLSGFCGEHCSFIRSFICLCKCSECG